MATTPSPAAPPVRSVVLDADGIPLSGLLALPADPVPRAVVVALHGAGMSAGYFDSRVRPGFSLLELGASLGFAVLALDRPGYGASAAALPRGLDLAGQTAALLAALDGYADGHGLGAGVFLVAHSNGGRLALSAAAGARGRLAPLGVDLCGVGRHFAVEPGQLPGADFPGQWRRHWGALRFYPPEAFRACTGLVRPVPAEEARETPAWPVAYPDVAAGVRAPVRFTFAEQELWWRRDRAAVEELLTPLSGASTEVVIQPHAGHNVSLGWASRSYHLRVMAFLEECLLAREPEVERVPATTDREMKKVDRDLT
ncbi:alpha/beta hydrolase [Streptomyces sp. NPDC093801]|uniref:alpha/beta hydrolase n=1 Tax=Streptomyces sp. NPDC093801 TaxID=3155203 RepID=UPI00344E3E0D